MPAVNPGTTNLSAWWSLNEASGQRSDSHGTNHLTDNNTVAQAAGVVGNSALFVQANAEYLSVADNAALSIGSGVSFTVGCWAYLDGVALRPLITKAAANTVAGIEFRMFTGNDGLGRLHANISTGAALLTAGPSGATLSINTWYFFAMVLSVSGHTLKAYVNGVERGSVATGGVSAQDAGGAFLIGKLTEATALYHGGRMDEAFLYKRALSVDELEWLYNAGAGRAYSELAAAKGLPVIAHWHETMFR